MADLFSLDLVKHHLKLDEIDDDDSYLNFLMQAAVSYVEDAVGRCDTENPKVVLLLLVLISNLYENRQYTIDKSSEKVQYVTHSMLLQLQLEEVPEDDQSWDS